MKTNDQENCSGQQVNVKLPADNDSNPSLFEREAITERWEEAIANADLHAAVKVPKELTKIALSQPDQVDGYRNVRLLNIHLDFPLNADAPPSIKNNFPPLIYIWVDHTGGHILKDAAFKEGVSKALTASIQKPVKLHLSGERLEDEGVALMHGVDDKSAWNLTDFIL